MKGVFHDRQHGGRQRASVSCGLGCEGVTLCFGGAGARFVLCGAYGWSSYVTLLVEAA